jgi:hypothetical protein
VTPNLRTTLPAEADAESLVREDALAVADQTSGGCRSGVSLSEG